MRSLLTQLSIDSIAKNRITSSPVGEVIDTVVIGAGHAGLALSCYLLRNGTEHGGSLAGGVPPSSSFREEEGEGHGPRI